MRWQEYPGYKPSGVEWLGEVPGHWRTLRLKYTSSINDEVLLENTNPDHEIQYVDISSVDAVEGIKKKEIIRFEEAPSRARRRVRDGDVIVSTVRTYLRAIAPINDPEDNLIVSTGFAVIRPKRDMNGNFAAYALRAPYFVEAVVARSVGVSYPAINAGEIGTLRIAIPPGGEQRAIAAFLDRETGRIDALMEKKQRQIELLQEKRAALISQAVTKGLDSSAPLKDSGVPWLTGVPQEWEVAPLGRVAPLQRGHDLPSEVRKSGNIPVVSSAGIVDYHSIPKAKGPGVITGRYGTIGEVFYVENDYWPLNTTLYVYDFRENHPRYIYYLILILPFSAHSDKSAVPGVNRNHLHPLLVLKPPIEDQKAIADFLDQETAKMDVLIAKVQESIDRLKEYRTALISAAVTGKIDVRGEVRKASAAFPRIVLAAEIVDRLNNDPNFHRVKFQKVLYLCEHHLGMDLEGNYWRRAAGPLDNRMLYSLENRIQRQKWFATRRDGQKVTYVPMEKAGGHRKYFDDYWADYREGLDSLLELMRPLNTERSEIVATLFAAWNDLIIGGVPFNDEDILREVKSNWHESKERFDEDRLRKALQWMRDKGLIPRGLGRATRT